MSPLAKFAPRIALLALPMILCSGCSEFPTMLDAAADGVAAARGGGYASPTSISCTNANNPFAVTNAMYAAQMNMIASSPGARNSPQIQAAAALANNTAYNSCR
jgi:hypothetical protein